VTFLREQGQSSLQTAVGSNFCIRPQIGFHRIASAPRGSLYHDCAAAQLCRLESNNRAARFELQAIRAFLTKSGCQFFARSCGALRDIQRREEMLNHFRVHSTPTILATLTYPIGNDRNKTRSFARRNPLDKSRAPNRDIGEIKFPADAGAVTDVHDTVIAAKPSCSQTGVTQSDKG